MQYTVIHDVKRIKNKPNSFYCIIPCFYEYHTIGKVLNRLDELFGNDIIKVVVISDENDPSKNIAINEGADIILLNNNRGYGLAILTGLNYILKKSLKNTYVMIIDADDTYRPTISFSRIIRNFIKNNDKQLVIVGKRILNKNSMPLQNRIGNILVNKLISIIGGFPLIDSQSGLKIFPLLLYPTLKELGMSLSEEIVLNAWLYDFKVMEIPVLYERRNSNSRSKLNLVTDGIKIIKLALIKSLLNRIWRSK